MLNLRNLDFAREAPPSGWDGDTVEFQLVVRSRSRMARLFLEARDELPEWLELDSEAQGTQTTKDGQYSVEFVECLASCGTAPVMMCNDSFHEGVGQKRADEILVECK